MAKYNVLFMRDDSPVRSMRVGRFWLRLFIYFQLALLVAAGVGGYAGYTQYLKSNRLQSKVDGLERQLASATVQLERLQNLERIRTASAAMEPTDEPRPLDLAELLSRVESGLISVDGLRLTPAKGGINLDFEINNLNENQTLSGKIRLAAVTRDGRVSPLTPKTNNLTFSIQRFKTIKTTVALPPDMAEEELFGVRVLVEGDGGTVLFSALYPMPVG